MLSTSNLTSSSFRRATGREKPPLKHPTANAFDRAPWELLAKNPDCPRRDRDLATFALFASSQIQALRTAIGESRLRAFSRRTALKLAMARANRASIIVSDRMSKAIQESRSSEAAHLSTLTRLPIGGSSMQPDLTADDVLTIAVDTLPHWFAQAAELGDERSSEPKKFWDVAAESEALLSIEHGFRDLWQQALWEGWAIKRVDGVLRFEPPNRDDSIRWYAWHARQEALLAARGLIDKNNEKNAPISERLSVTSIRRNGKNLRYSLGNAKKGSRDRVNFMNSSLNSSYVAPFMEISIDEEFPDITPRFLMSVWYVIFDFCRENIKLLRSIETDTYQSVSDLSLPVKSTTLVSAVRDCLRISGDLAEKSITLLTSDPTDLSAVFSRGVWHRPLIKYGDDELLLCAPAILHGQPVRCVERWLQDSGVSERLGKTPPGIIFEAVVRKDVHGALAENELIDDWHDVVAGIPKKGDSEEEIDLLFRIGNSIFLGEIKCFLVPDESSERFDYLRKVEEAADQAQRKTAWIKENKVT